MSNQNILYSIGALIVIVAAGFGIAYYVTTPETGSEITYVIEEVKDGTYTGALPPLDHDPVFSASMPEEARVAIMTRIEKNRAQLTDHPEDGNAWMELALWYHSANDYDAARVVWEVIVATTPDNVPALNNLGRLHHFEVPDFPLAESYLLKSLAANPDRLEVYIDLFDLYRYSYKTNTTAAVDIMKKAMVQFPDEWGLGAQLGAYYRDTGRPTLARAEFEKVLKTARDAGMLDVVSTMNAELARLP